MQIVYMSSANVKEKDPIKKINKNIESLYFLFFYCCSAVLYTMRNYMNPACKSNFSNKPDNELQCSVQSHSVAVT